MSGRKRVRDGRCPAPGGGQGTRPALCARPQGCPPGDGDPDSRSVGGAAAQGGLEERMGGDAGRRGAGISLGRRSRHERSRGETERGSVREDFGLVLCQGYYDHFISVFCAEMR